MFTSLRYLSLVCMLLLLGAGGFLWSHARHVQEAELTAWVRTHALASLSAYTETLWRHHAVLDQNAPHYEENKAALRAASEAFFRNQPFLKVTIFSPDMLHLYYGSNQDYVTYDGSARVPLFDLPAIQKGLPRLRMIPEAYVHHEQQASPSRAVVQLILPILPADLSPQSAAACYEGVAKDLSCRPEALVELYLDLTPMLRGLLDPQTRQMAWLGGLLFLALLILFMIARRAAAEIARYHDANMELTAAVTQAEAQNRDKSQFLAGVSHELRTPLNAIIGFSEILQHQAGKILNKECNHYLEDILSSGKHLLSLINDILDFSKAEAGKLQIDWAETDVTKVIRNSLRMVMPRAETAQITLIEEVPAEHFVMVTDGKKLKQVLLNLLSNAVKFTRGGGQVRCRAWEDIANQTVMIQVSDTGIGIAPKDISRVMAPFGQVDSSLSRKYEGTGLGLPLAKKFVESMGGEFHIESALHVGTTVTLRLPIHAHSLSPSAPVPTVSPDPSLPSSSPDTHGTSDVTPPDSPQRATISTFDDATDESL